MDKAQRTQNSRLTILKEILKKYTARQLRLAFMMQLWNNKVDFSITGEVTGEVRTAEMTLNVSTGTSRRPTAPTANSRFNVALLSTFPLHALTGNRYTSDLLLRIHTELFLKRQSPDPSTR